MENTSPWNLGNPGNKKKWLRTVEDQIITGSMVFPGFIRLNHRHTLVTPISDVGTHHLLTLHTHPHPHPDTHTVWPVWDRRKRVWSWTWNLQYPLSLVDSSPSFQSLWCRLVESIGVMKRLTLRYSVLPRFRSPSTDPNPRRVLLRPKLKMSFHQGPTKPVSSWSLVSDATSFSRGFLVNQCNTF